MYIYIMIGGFVEGAKIDGTESRGFYRFRSKKWTSMVLLSHIKETAG